MPREDVPYPGRAICSLKERIAELEDAVDEKLETINGVPGDGDGNVKILSGSAAVVVTNDQTQNEITIGLDTGQLPAAPVTSVNTQTGAVVLDASDIGSTNGNVQTDIDNLETADTQNVKLAVAQTVTADKTWTGEQTYNNTATHNGQIICPTDIDTPRLVMKRTNLWADADVQGPRRGSIIGFSDTGDNVFVKLTPWKSLTDSHLSLYGSRDGHTDVWAGEAGVKTDGTGYMMANTPGASADSHEVTTVGYVSDTGGLLNNLVHTNGNETLNGTKAFTGNIQQNRQYSYIDFIHSDKTINFHKGVRFMLGNTYNGQILYTWNATGNSCGLSIQIVNPYNNISGSFNFNIDSNGNKTLITDFPKPSNTLERLFK